MQVHASLHNVDADAISFAENGGTRWINLGSDASLFIDRANGVEQAIALIAAAEAVLTSFGATRGTVQDHLDTVGSKLAVRHAEEVASGRIRTLEVPA